MKPHEVAIIVGALLLIAYLWYRSGKQATANPTSAVGSSSKVKSCCGAIL